MPTNTAALEQARAIFDNAPNDPDWSAIPAIAAALLRAEAKGMEEGMRKTNPYANRFADVDRIHADADALERREKPQ